MNLKNFYVLVSLLPMLFSCGSGSQADKELFNGEIQEINDKEVVCKDISAKHVLLDGIYTGTVAAYDSLLICWDTSYPGHFINLFNVDTGKEIGYFCPKGGGPDELFNTNPVYQFFKKGDDVMTLFDGNSQSLAVWNLTKSVQTGKTVYDTIVRDYKGLDLFFFRLSDDALLNVVSAQPKNMHEVMTPYCERRPLDTTGEVQKFPLYKVESVSGKSADSFFNSWSALKPDGTKLVQAMGYLPQLNIIDTRTGQVTGYRMKVARTIPCCHWIQKARRSIIFPCRPMTNTSMRPIGGKRSGEVARGNLCQSSTKSMCSIGRGICCINSRRTSLSSSFGWIWYATAFTRGIGVRTKYTIWI